MTRPPRNAKKDRLVDWKLILHAYGFIGVIETILSFTMSYWYCQKSGLSFGSLWFGFGSTPDNLSSDEVSAILATASSIYFVNLVIMQWFNLMATRTRRLSIFQHPPAFNELTQNYLLFPAILFALVVVFIFCYIPQLQVSSMDFSQRIVLQCQSMIANSLTAYRNFIPNPSGVLLPAHGSWLWSVAAGRESEVVRQEVAGRIPREDGMVVEQSQLCLTLQSDLGIGSIGSLSIERLSNTL